jgi:hypothetical protein
MSNGYVAAPSHASQSQSAYVSIAVATPILSIATPLSYANNSSPTSYSPLANGNNHPHYDATPHHQTPAGSTTATNGNGNGNGNESTEEIPSTSTSTEGVTSGEGVVDTIYDIAMNYRVNKVQVT